MAKLGRPSSYTPEVGLAICERLANGESLQAICRDDAMPRREKVLRWLAANPDFRTQYALAREEQADLLADQIVEIADTPFMGIKIKDGRVIECDMIEHRRLQVDARKWFASKVAPKKYGDRVATELTGKDGGPIETSNLSDIEKARRIAFLLGRAADKGKKP